MSSMQYAQRFVHPEDAPIVGREVQLSIETTDPHFSREIDHRIFYGDGQPGYITVRFRIEKDAQGRTVKTYGANQDITARKQVEQALKETEERFRTIAETSPVPLLISHIAEGTVLYGNEHLGEMFGIPIASLIGRQTPDFYFDAADRLPLLTQLKREGVVRNYELHVKQADGTPFWVLVSMRPITFDNQPALLAAFYDITERKQIEETLSHNEAQLSEALKIAKLAYWEYDVEKDRFQFNDQFYALFHTTAEQVGGYQISSAQYAGTFVYPDDLPIVGMEIERALNSTDRHYTRQLEHRILYADGGVGHISVSINIDRDEQGQILRYYGANQDITERKLAEQEFSRFRQGLEQASDAVFMTDVNGHITYVNPAFERIYGYTPAEVLGQTPRILKSGQLSQEYYRNFWRTLLNKQSVSGEKPNKTKDGRVIIVEDSNSPILDSSGALLGFLSSHRDVTERKQAEQRMAETLRETERLYAAVSHESWQTYRQAGQLNAGYLFDRALVQPADNVWEPEIAHALEQQALITSHSEQRAVAAAPLAVRGEAIGALGVYDDPAHPLNAEDQQLIEAVAEQVALALESARLFDQTQMALADTHALFRFSDLASRETEIKPIYDSVAQLLVEETGFAGTWIAQVDAEAQVLRGIAGAGVGMGPDRNFDVIPYQHMQMPVTIAARDRVMIVVNDPLHDERLSDLPEQMKMVVGKAIAMPVIIDGEIESVIAATRPIDGLDIGERDQRLLQTAAAQIAVAIQRARLFEQTQRDAEREHTINRVTSRIRNARSVDEVLSIAAQELRLATRASRSVVEILPVTDQPIGAGYDGNENAVDVLQPRGVR
jgi:PAS domain S-box-containing protein